MVRRGKDRNMDIIKDMYKKEVDVMSNDHYDTKSMQN